jgi:hypothetical protein
MKIWRLWPTNQRLPLAAAAVALLSGGCWNRTLPTLDPGAGGGTGGVRGSGGGNVPPLGTGGAASTGGTVGTVMLGPPTPTGKLDVLFMIDDSSSMAPLQAKLAAQMPGFMNALVNPATNVKPDLHVAVVSSSLGAGAWGNVNQCASEAHPGDDQGKFQQGPGGAGSGACAMLHTGQTYLKSGDGTAANAPNFDGDIATALACMASLGDSGCGFESQFESVYYALYKGGLALGPSDATHDPDNGGFLRADAQLAIIMLTNEDDCSVASDSLLLDPGINSATDPSGLGALASYRCNEFGHLCAGSPPPHGYPTVIPEGGVTLASCVSAEDSGKTDPLIADPLGNPDPTMGHLWPTVADFTTFIGSLKTNPADIFVVAIAGPTVDATGASLYKVVPTPNPAANGETDPMIAHSCTQAATGDPEYADPAVRIKQWVDNFGPNGVFYPICAADFQGTMTGVAASMRAQLGL